MSKTADSARSSGTRDAILDAALRVAAVHGVRGITHRKVAAEAGISLGSTNYHFASIDELVLEAFRRFSVRERVRYDRMFDAATSTSDVIDAILFTVAAQYEQRDRAILLYELYAQGVRDPSYRSIVRTWSRATHLRIARLYTEAVAARAEVVIEGLTFQRLLGDHPITDAQARDMLEVLLPAELSDRAVAVPRRSASG